MNPIKTALRPLIKLLGVNKLRTRKSLFDNYMVDLKLYKKYSIAFDIKGLKNKEAELILNYHSIEKGLLHYNVKKAFAKDRILKLHRIMNDEEIIHNIQRSQIRVGFQVMCKYYEVQKLLGYDVSDFYTEDQYNNYKNILGALYNPHFNGINEWNKDNFYKSRESNFYEFSHSRKSIREFTEELVPIGVLKKVVELANTAPSVCNRQASNLYLVQDKEKIDKILNIQGGFRGYSENVKQLLILTNDRQYYYILGERNQLYVDGGIFLMNLLYALHYYKIANCPIHWGKTFDAEKALSEVIDLPESEKIICMIPIGIAPDQFRTTLSARRNEHENFRVL